MSIVSKLVDKNCPACNKSYKADPKRLKHGRQTSCSRACSYALRIQKIAEKSRGRKRVKKNKPSITTGERVKKIKPSIVCKSCGNDFIPPFKPKKFCSMICRNTESRLLKNTCPECNTNFKPFSRHTKYCSRACFLAVHSRTMKGDNNPSWIDGRSKNKVCYRGESWEEQRLLAYERDDYNCQSCGVKCIGKRAITPETTANIIQCHHIISYHETHDNSLENLITLCVSCHKNVHEGRIKL